MHINILDVFSIAMLFIRYVILIVLFFEFEIISQKRQS